MTQRILDATDIHSNTTRFCDECRVMLTVTRNRDVTPGKLVSVSTLLFPRQLALAKGSAYVHKQLWDWRDRPTSCEICIFLRCELGEGSDTALPSTGIKAFALPGEAAAEFVDVLQPPFDPSADAVFIAAKEWIKTCRASHQQCEVTGRTGLPLLPTRVIDVGTGDRPTVRLHVSTSGERGVYACLSYCWGGDQFKTMSGTLEKLVTKIPHCSLSLTVADAVEATRRLGLRYLWVDALCIVQDSDEDKAREIVKMGVIYKNAAVTIAAAAAQAASEGFLRTLRQDFRSAVLRVPLPSGEIGIVRLTLTNFFDLGQLRRRQEHPLDKRGWCLQEYFLSPRLLVFSNFNVERLCQVGSVEFASDGPFGGRPSAVIRSRLPPGIFGGATKRDMWDKLVHADIVRYADRIKLWKDLVEDFSSRELSDLQDRLHGLAGIAGELQRLWRDDYMYGMWKAIFPRTVAWKTLLKDGRRPNRLTLAPTWSWASVSSGVEFMRLYNPKLVDITYETGGKTTVASSPSSFNFPCLTVTGTLIRPSDRSSTPLGATESLVIWPDLDEPFAEKEWSYLVIDRETRHWPDVVLKRTTTTYLILEESSDTGVYSRVGLAQHEQKFRNLLEDDSPWLKLSRGRTTSVRLV